MTPFEKLDRFLRNLYETGFYFLAMAVKENFRNYVGRAGTAGAPAPTMAILGNGPALSGSEAGGGARFHGGQLLR